MQDSSTASEATPESVYSKRQNQLEHLAQTMPASELDRLQEQHPQTVLEVRLKKLELQNLPPKEMHQAMVELHNQRKT